MSVCNRMFVFLKKNKKQKSNSSGVERVGWLQRRLSIQGPSGITCRFASNIVLLWSHTLKTREWNHYEERNADFQQHFSYSSMAFSAKNTKHGLMRLKRTIELRTDMGQRTHWIGDWINELSTIEDSGVNESLDLGHGVQMMRLTCIFTSVSFGTSFDCLCTSDFVKPLWYCDIWSWNLLWYADGAFSMILFAPLWWLCKWANDDVGCRLSCFDWTIYDSWNLLSMEWVLSYKNQWNQYM